MIVLWVVGDAFKVYYYISNNQPVQLMIGTLCMVTFDVFILIQFWIYREGTSKKIQQEKDAVKAETAKKAD